MHDLPKITDLDIEGKRVMVRADLDLPVVGLRTSDFGKDARLRALIPTLKHLYEHKARKIVIIGHRGRPSHEATDGKTVQSDNESLSLKPVSKVLEEMLANELREDEMKKLDMHVMENLRFNAGEESNDEHFAKHLAEQVDVYVNEAFSTSHRKHASIVVLPQAVRSKCYLEDGQPLADKSKGGCVAVGIHFEEEIEELNKILDNPKKPVVVIISGVKEDKLSYVEPILKFADKVLVGGRLPEYFEKFAIRNSQFASGKKLIVAKLLPDKEDITIHSIEIFEEEIIRAGTIILSGPVGKYEDGGHRQGTERVFKAVVANKNAFKVAGGGDTESAIRLFDLTDGFNWISVGGGAMLEFLAKGTLPGIEALK